MVPKKTESLRGGASHKLSQEAGGCRHHGNSRGSGGRRPPSKNMSYGPRARCTAKCSRQNVLGKLFTGTCSQHVFTTTHSRQNDCGKMFVANCSQQNNRGNMIAAKCSQQNVVCQIPDSSMFQNGPEDGGNPCTRTNKTLCHLSQGTASWSCLCSVVPGQA